MYDQAVLIGRFQPFHNEHLRLLDNTLKEADHVTILLGSLNSSRNFRNPWTVGERMRFIMEGVGPERLKRMSFEGIRDYLYNDNKWIAQVQQKVHLCGAKAREMTSKGQLAICLSGSKKDNTSQYLDYFPAWRRVTGSLIHPLNATDIREKFFSKDGSWKEDVPKGTADALELWRHTNQPVFEQMAEEQRFIKKYKEDWKPAPYPPIFVTVDPVVVCGGHILVVRRGNNPGKGLYALPGGFLDQDETVKEGAIRELMEETNLLVPRDLLVASMGENKVFDHPLRSLRGRTVTHAQLFVLNTDSIPHIKAGDDAAAAEWMSLSDLQENESQFYEDHYHIISYFVMKL